MPIPTRRDSGQLLTRQMHVRTSALRVFLSVMSGGVFGVPGKPCRCQCSRHRHSCHYLFHSSFHDTTHSIWHTRCAGRHLVDAWDCGERKTKGGRWVPYRLSTSDVISLRRPRATLIEMRWKEKHEVSYVRDIGTYMTIIYFEITKLRKSTGILPQETMRAMFGIN
jgi:hypothetical protein